MSTSATASMSGTQRSSRNLGVGRSNEKVIVDAPLGPHHAMNAMAAPRRPDWIRSEGAVEKPEGHRWAWRPRLALMPPARSMAVTGSATQVLVAGVVQRLDEKQPSCRAREVPRKPERGCDSELEPRRSRSSLAARVSRSRRLSQCGSRPGADWSLFIRNRTASARGNSSGTCAMPPVDVQHNIFREHQRGFVSTRFQLWRGETCGVRD